MLSRSALWAARVCRLAKDQVSLQGTPTPQFPTQEHLPLHLTPSHPCTQLPIEADPELRKQACHKCGLTANRRRTATSSAWAGSQAYSQHGALAVKRRRPGKGSLGGGLNHKGGERVEGTAVPLFLHPPAGNPASYARWRPLSGVQLTSPGVACSCFVSQQGLRPWASEGARACL